MNNVAHPASRTFVQGLLGVSSPWNQVDPPGRDKQVTQLARNSGGWHRIPGWQCRRPVPGSLSGRAIGQALSEEPRWRGGVKWACLEGWGEVFRLDPSHLPTPTQENTYKSKLEGNYGTFV